VVGRSIQSLEGMPVRLSDQPEYLTAIPAFASRDYGTARDNLNVLITRLRSGGEPSEIAFLLHILGDVEAESGHPDKGHALHQEAISLDEGHPSGHISYAKGLLRSFNQRDRALDQLRKAEEIVRSTAWVPDEDDLPRTYYEKEIAEIRGEIARHAL
jgi:predicted Zn-dependent protease